MNITSKARRTASRLAPALRQQAEQELREQQPSAAQPLSETDARALVHELQVHQIELEMQNEELQRAQVEARQAADKYTELFDFAPVGYFVLDPHGVVTKVNLAGAALLGLDRQRVTGQSFEQYVVPECRAGFSTFCLNVQPGEARRSCEVRLLKRGPDPCDVLIEGTAESASSDGHSCRLAVTDITERNLADAALHEANENLLRHVAERTKDLRESNEELARFNRAMVGRELRMIELKKEINEFCRQAGQPPRYLLPSEEETP